MGCTILNELPPAPKGKVGWPWTVEGVSLPGGISNATQWPKISIVTPSFNQGVYIEETIRSVLLQGYPNLEYIIIDGVSTDETVEIIKKYEPWLSYWVSEKDSGQSDAINKGLRLATGDVVNWLNSDDYYEPGALFKVGRAFINPETNVYCGISRVFGKGNVYFSRGTDIYPENLEKTIGWARIDQPETFFRKSVWEVLGEVDSRFHYVMDKEFWIRYLLKFGLGGIEKGSEHLVHYRLHGESKTVSQAAFFQKETVNLFCSLAAMMGLEDASDDLQVSLKAQRIEINNEWNGVDACKMLNYFVFNQLAAAYAVNDTERYRQLRRLVNKSLLSPEDQQEFSRLELRSRIPIFLKKWWNKR